MASRPTVAACPALPVVILAIFFIQSIHELKRIKIQAQIQKSTIQIDEYDCDIKELQTNNFLWNLSALPIDLPISSKDVSAENLAVHSSKEVANVQLKDPNLSHLCKCVTNYKQPTTEEIAKFSACVKKLTQIRD